MITLRRSGARGRTDLDWLESRHSFSFGSYFDPAQMGFGPLRVINEDRIAPGGGFPTHGHRDMEILTYIVDGALEHRDSLGTGSVIGRGEVQRMTAGTGIRHSEFNASGTEPVHLLQIWIEPAAPGLAPGYEQKMFPDEAKRNRLCPIATGDGRDGSVAINRDAAVYAALLESGRTLDHATDGGRFLWIQAVGGSVEIGGERLGAGDGAAIEGETAVALVALTDAEVLLFDMA